MVSVAVVGLSTPTLGTIRWVVDWEAEFLEYGVFDVPILEAVGRGVLTHAHQRVQR